MSSHDYEGIMLVLCTPLQVKCYRIRITGTQSSGLHWDDYIMLYFYYHPKVLGSARLFSFSWWKKVTVFSKIWKNTTVLDIDRLE